jgi:pimeloyl-ACP methyl ester carboxylesterase
VRPDLPGFGDTPARTSPGFDVASRSALVGELLDALELPPVVVIGHSMGGVVAAHLALARPDRVQRLVLAASPGLVLHRGMRHLPFGALTRLLATERRARVLRPVSKRVFDYFGFRGRYPPDAYRRTVLQAAGVDIAAHAARLRRLTLPTAVVWCEDDPLVEPVIGDGIAAAVPPGPRLRFADGGHNPQKHHAIEIAACLAADWHESGKRGTSDPA